MKVLENNFIEWIIPELIEQLPVGVVPGDITVRVSLGEEYRSAVR